MSAVVVDVVVVGCSVIEVVGIGIGDDDVVVGDVVVCVSGRECAHIV